MNKEKQGSIDFKKDDRRGWDFRPVDIDAEINGYFAYDDPLPDECSGKLGGDKKIGFRSCYSLSRGCKYDDEKDPLCTHYANNLTGCCTYHRYKYNELLQGEKISDFVIQKINERGGKIEKEKLQEWK